MPSSHHLSCSSAVSKPAVRARILQALRLLFTCVALSVAGYPAHAIPIPNLTGVDYFLSDNLSNFDLFVLGGPVIQSEQNLTFNAGVNWKINLDIIIENNLTPNRDRVSVFGEVFHMSEPHPPEGVGQTLGFSFVFDPALPVGSPVSVGIPSSKKHKNDFDNYSFYDGAKINGEAFSHFGVVGGGPAGGSDITRWFFGIKGLHTATPIPEPGVGWMLILGSLGLYFAARKRAAVIEGSCALPPAMRSTKFK